MDAIKAAIRAEREAFRVMLAKVRAIVAGRNLPPETAVDMVSSELDERDWAEKRRKEMD